MYIYRGALVIQRGDDREEVAACVRELLARGELNTVTRAELALRTSEAPTLNELAMVDMLS